MLRYCFAICISKESNQGVFLLCCFYSTVPMCLCPFLSFMALVDMAVLGLWLDLMILKVFSNL